MNGGNVGIGTASLAQKLNLGGNLKFTTANTGIQFADNSSITTANNLVRNGSSNIELNDGLKIGGTNPYLRVGSFAIQDITVYNFIPPTYIPTDPNTQITQITTSPEAFVFGNIYYDENTNRYKPVYKGDSIRVVNNGQVVLSTPYNSNGATAMRFNSDKGSIEFITIPYVGSSFTKEELLANRNLAITRNGSIGIGTVEPADGYKLDVAGNVKIAGNAMIAGNGNILGNAEIAGNSTITGDVLVKRNANILGNTEIAGNVGIGTFTPSEKLEVNGNVRISGNTNGIIFPDGSKLTSAFWNKSSNILSYTGNVQIVGTVAAKIVVANATATPDYVFEKNYNLPTLQETNDYVQKNKHLPYLKSAKELESAGIDMTEHTNGILRHVEEMYLHIIRLEDEIKQLKSAKK